VSDDGVHTRLQFAARGAAGALRPQRRWFGIPAEFSIDDGDVVTHRRHAGSSCAGSTHRVCRQQGFLIDNLLGTAELEAMEQTRGRLAAKREEIALRAASATR
jgi:hypothetical protein